MNLYHFDIPEKLESFETLLAYKNIKIVRIVSSDQLEERLYIQEEDEWIVLLEGEALLEVDGRNHSLKKGDSLFIPAKTSHRVLSTKKGTLWLAIHIF